MAHKCDKCDKLYAPAIDNVAVEYHVVQDIEDAESVKSVGYSADLCPTCSAVFLEFIRHD